MSETINETNENTEVTFGVTGRTGEYLIEFADGVRPLGGYVVDGLGGEEMLKDKLPALKQVTFADFMAAYNLMREKRNLNEIGSRFISSHFSGYRS